MLKLNILYSLCRRYTLSALRKLPKKGSFVWQHSFPCCVFAKVVKSEHKCPTCRFPLRKEIIMQNIKLTLQYDGARYLGWQRPQKDGCEKTISHKLVSILQKMTGESILLHAGQKQSRASTPQGRQPAFKRRLFFLRIISAPN